VLVSFPCLRHHNHINSRKDKVTLIFPYFVSFLYDIFEKKLCPKCGKNRLQKYGRSRWKQRYKCLIESCNAVFIPKNLSWIAQAQKDYIIHKQNYSELAGSIWKDRNTLQKYITRFPLVTGEIPVFAPDIRFGVIIDVTYLRGKTDGLALIRTNTEFNLNSDFVTSESIESMTKLLCQFDAAGYPPHAHSFTIDGRRFMFRLLWEKYPHIPIQMCLFHMKAIIRRGTTMRPKTKLWKALLILKACLGLVNETMFKRLFSQIESLYGEFLLERNIHGEYEHRKLRTVMNSIRWYLPYLYAFEHFSERGISRTTSECDGYFSHIKDKLRVHRWLREKNRNNFIIFLLEEKNRMLQNSN
jgi:hypothetical protein